MDVYRPIGAGLFFFECVRLLLLIAFLLFASPESSADGGGFPYQVYLSANALFLLMVLFVWLRPGEYRNYLTLYMAGKVIAAVSFYGWGFFSPRAFLTGENIVKSMILLGGGVFISLGDIFSVWGAWILKNKLRTETLPGLLQTAGQSVDIREDIQPRETEARQTQAESSRRTLTDSLKSGGM